MTLRPRTATIKRVPKNIDRHTGREFLRELAVALQTERPSIVLDCAHMHQVDATAIHLLLCCLEEAMKRNGDVRLASLTAEGREALRTWGVDHLFRIFETTEQAAESFQRRAAFVQSSSASNEASLASEHAA